MPKPVSQTPLRDTFEEIWGRTHVDGEDESKESAFGMFMVGVHCMLFVVPAEARDLVEAMSIVTAAREEVKAYGKLTLRKAAEQN